MPEGGQDSGENVIRAFEHRYYSQRSGQAARELVSPDADPSAPFTVTANLDAGIATVPAGTTYCLGIAPVLAGVYAVTITETRPDGARSQYAQQITTGVVDGRHVIESITEAQES